MASNELRMLIREVLREVIEDPSERIVEISDDATLNAFVQKIVAEAESAEFRAGVRSGKIRYKLTNKLSASSPRNSKTVVVAPSLVVEKGVVTEKTVAEALNRGATVIESPKKLVVTPLARENAKRHGIEVRVSK